MDQNANETTQHHHDIAPGQYKGRGVEGSEQFGSGDKGDQVAIDLLLVDINRTVTTVLHFSDAAMPYSIDRLRLMGVPIGANNAIETLEGISKNEVPVLVKYESWTDPSTGETKETMRVDIISTRFSFKTPMSEPEKRGFFAKVNAFARQRAEGASKSATPAAATSYPDDWDKKPDPNRPPLNIE